MTLRCAATRCTCHAHACEGCSISEVYTNSWCIPDRIDYIKIDACRGAKDMNTSWSRFHEGLTKCYKDTGKEIVQSVESCDSPTGCGQWVTKVANLWRTGGDVQNYWGSILNNIYKNDKMQTIASPGRFNGELLIDSMVSGDGVIVKIQW